MEAARASEQGRGFAVVAGRKCVTRASRSARRRRRSTAYRLHHRQRGNRLRYVHLAGESMDEIRASIGSVSGIMREISIATSEQMKRHP